MISIVREFFNYSLTFYKHLGSKILVVFLLNLIGGFLDILGISMIIPVFQIFFEDEKATNPEITDSLHFIFGSEITSNFSTLLVVISLLFLFKGIFIFLSLSMVAYILSRFMAIMKITFFDLLKSVSYEYYLSRDTGYFINIANEQINLALSSFSNYAKLVSQILKSKLRTKQ